MAPRFFLDRIPDALLHGRWPSFMPAGTLAAHDDISAARPRPSPDRRLDGRTSKTARRWIWAIPPSARGPGPGGGSSGGQPAARSAVRLFQSGGARWVEGETRPAAAERSLYLAGDGLAAARSDAGSFDALPGVSGSDSLRTTSAAGSALGGHWAGSAAPPTAALDDRGDVAVYMARRTHAPRRPVGGARGGGGRPATTPACTLSG